MGYLKWNMSLGCPYFGMIFIINGFQCPKIIWSIFGEGLNLKRPIRTTTPGCSFWLLMHFFLLIGDIIYVHCMFRGNTDLSNQIQWHVCSFPRCLSRKCQLPTSKMPNAAPRSAGYSMPEWLSNSERWWTVGSAKNQTCISLKAELHVEIWTKYCMYT